MLNYNIILCQILHELVTVIFSIQSRLTLFNRHVKLFNLQIIINCLTAAAFYNTEHPHCQTNMADIHSK